MLCIVQNLGFRCCSPQQQRWNSYMGEIRTDCSICQCKGPLKGLENLMSTHSLPCTLTFSQQYEVTYEEKTSTSSRLLLCEQNGLSLVSLKSSQKIASKTNYSLNESGQELVFLDDLCISCYFCRQLLFGTMTFDLWGSFWILERAKEHKVYWSTSPGLQALQGEGL